LVTPEVADASAAVVVSVLIFLTLIPLISGMIQTFKSLKHVNRLLKMKGSDGNEDEDQVELLRFA
jgi:F0F1-type ATP synthase assembly protein I